MEHLDHPTEELWEQRRHWFEAHIFHYEERGSYLVGEQACALISEVQSCFCAGAWAAVVMLAFSVIEANLKEIDPSAKKSKVIDLLKANEFDDRFHHLRMRRNCLIHGDHGCPAITVEQQWDNRAELELEAKEAVGLMFEAFYSQAGT